MPLTRRRVSGGTSSRMDEVVARWLLGGFAAIPPMDDLAPEVRDRLFELYQDHARPARQLFAEHDRDLRHQARRWGIDPSFAFEPRAWPPVQPDDPVDEGWP